MDYSCLPGNADLEVTPSDDPTHAPPGFSLITSISSFDNTTLRKQSLSKTFSHPGLLHAFEAEGTSPSLSLLAARRPSITRVSSCPPAIQASSEETEPTERSQEKRYAPCPRTGANMPHPSLPSRQELLVLMTDVESPATENSEEMVDSDGSSNDGSGTDDGGAEAMAMRSLAKHFSTSVQQSSVASVPPVAETQPEILSAISDAGIRLDDEENNEQLSECGSSSYIKLGTATSTPSEYTGASQPVHQKEKTPEKSRAGSYVQLSTAAQGSMPQDQAKGSNIFQSSSTVHSTVGCPRFPAPSLQSPAGKEAATRCSSSEPCSQDSEHQTPLKTEMSPYEKHPKMKETSYDVKDVGFVSSPCKSPDELLGSLSSGRIQKEMGSVALTELLTDIEDGSFEERSSPLITDLQEESEDDHPDFRGFAELSLGQFSHPISNVGLELNEISEQPSIPEEEHSQPCADGEQDSAKVSSDYINNQPPREHSRQEESTLSEDSQLSLGTFCHPTSNVGLDFNTMSEQSFPVLEEEHSHYSSQPHADIEMDNSKVSKGFISDEELHEHSQQENGTLSEESQLSLGKCSHPLSLGLTMVSEGSLPVFEEEHSHYSAQACDDLELDGAKVCTDYISHHELHGLNRQEDSTLPEENQGDNSSPVLDPFGFCRNTSTSVNPSMTEEICSLLPGLTNNTTYEEESDQENEDAAINSDIELDSLSGPVGYSPGNVEVLRSPFLMFDQGQEKLEMKEFSLNNLSKENLKSTRFPVFNDDHFLTREISSLCSNQLDDALSEDGCSLNGDQEAEGGTQGSIWVDPSYKEMGGRKGKF